MEPFLLLRATDAVDRRAPPPGPRCYGLGKAAADRAGKGTEEGKVGETVSAGSAESLSAAPFPETQTVSLHFIAWRV